MTRFNKFYNSGKIVCMGAFFTFLLTLPAYLNASQHDLRLPVGEDEIYDIVKKSMDELDDSQKAAGNELIDLLILAPDMTDFLAQEYAGTVLNAIPDPSLCTI
ncbi:hypothetical protein ACFL2G_04305 [Candidatus Omnitrophota bacterium]